jgi:hypothetical protein
VPEPENRWQDHYSEELVVSVWRELRKVYDSTDEEIASEVIKQVLEQCPTNLINFARKIAPMVAAKLQRPHQQIQEDGSKKQIRREYPAGLQSYARHMTSKLFDKPALEEELAGRDEEAKAAATGWVRMAECHPEREHHGHGKCWACYIRDRGKVKDAG